jgi:hypothetical protein
VEVLPEVTQVATSVLHSLRIDVAFSGFPLQVDKDQQSFLCTLVSVFALHPKRVQTLNGSICDYKNKTEFQILDFNTSRIPQKVRIYVLVNENHIEEGIQQQLEEKFDDDNWLRFLAVNHPSLRSLTLLTDLSHSYEILKEIPRLYLRNDSSPTITIKPPRLSAQTRGSTFHFAIAKFDSNKSSNLSLNELLFEGSSVLMRWSAYYDGRNFEAFTVSGEIAIDSNMTYHLIIAPTCDHPMPLSYACLGNISGPYDLLELEQEVKSTTWAEKSMKFSMISLLITMFVLVYTFI